MSDRNILVWPVCYKLVCRVPHELEGVGEAVFGSHLHLGDALMC